jgi:hypothetical protein
MAAGNINKEIIMVKTLRNGHLRIWRTWAFLLPIGIITAWLSIPPESKQSLLQSTTSKGLPVIFSLQEREKYTVCLRGTADTSALQLVWTNTDVLTYPSTVIYRNSINSKGIENATIIGRVEGRGGHTFIVDSSFAPAHFAEYKLIFYDFIHGQVLDVIHF